MKKCKKIVAFLLLVVLTLIPFTGCSAQDPNYMPCPIFAEAVYTAETWKGIGFVEYPYYTVYTPESLDGLHIKVDENNNYTAELQGYYYPDEHMKYFEDMDGYKILKLFHLLKAEHFYHYDKEEGIHKYYIDIVFDNEDGSSERIYIYTDEYGYLTKIKTKDGDLDATLTRMILDE